MRRVYKLMFPVMLVLVGINVFFVMHGYWVSSYWDNHWDTLLNMVVCLAPFFTVVILPFGIIGAHYCLVDWQWLDRNKYRSRPRRA